MPFDITGCLNLDQVCERFSPYAIIFLIFIVYLACPVDFCYAQVAISDFINEEKKDLNADFRLVMEY